MDVPWKLFGFMFLWLNVQGTWRLNRQWLWFEMSQKMGTQLKVSSDRLEDIPEEQRIELRTLEQKASDLLSTTSRGPT